MDSTDTARKGALSHIRICDFTGQLAGAGATRLLAAFGAEVIRVEDPSNQGGWDILRGMLPFVDERTGTDFGGGFNNHNVEKRGITLNLRSERGRELLRELVAVSDVVTENFAAGVFERLGFHYESLRAIRPDIIYVSNCGFGHSGPYRDFKTWGPIVQAVCGLTFSSGLRDQPPAGWGYSYMDHGGGYFMAVGILMALLHRARSGEGQWVDMSCTEAGASLLGPSLLDATVNDRPLRREGMPDSNRESSPEMAPHGIYPCQGEDNWVAIACRSDADWRQLRSFLDEDWARESRFDGLAGRIQHQDALDAAMTEWTRCRERFEVQRQLQAVGVPAAAVQRPQERIDQDPDTAHVGLWPEVEHSKMGRVRVDGLPVHLSRTDWKLERGGPCLGEHNQEVLCGLLGVPEAELPELREAGVI